MSKPDEPNFDRVARIYRWAEYASLGSLLQRTRRYFLPALRECRRAMVLGDGDGRFLAKLMAQNALMQAVAVDTSAAMLELLRRNCVRAAANAEERQTLVRASALETMPAEDTDLIVTHFFLDCLTQAEVETLCGRVVARLENGALWVVSEFRIPEGTMRWPARALVRGLYIGFRMLAGLRTAELPDHTRALRAAGFVKVAQRLSLAGVLTAEVWQLVVAGE